MAADSADAVDTPDRYERLAELVDAIESEGTQVTDTDTRILHDDTLRATIEVEIDEGRLEPARTQTLRGARPPQVSIEMQRTEEALEDADVDAEEIVDELENDEDDENRGQASISRPRNGDESDDQDEECPNDHDDLDEGVACSECGHVEPLSSPAVDADASAAKPDESEAPPSPAESDIVPGDIENDEDEQEDQAPAAEPVDDPLAEQIVSILEAEGELRSSDLRDRVDGNQTEFYDACDDLKEADRLSVRDDPDDGRRKLYSLADDQDDAPEWNGRDPETIVADSSLPARVVLEDILNAVADASTVIEAAETLDVDVDNLEPVCWHLTLKQPDSLEIVGDIEDRIKTVQEVADVE